MQKTIKAFLVFYILVSSVLSMSSEEKSVYEIISISPPGKYLLVRHDSMISDDPSSLAFTWDHSIARPIDGLTSVYSMQTKYEVWDKSAYTLCDAITKQRLTKARYGKDFAGKKVWFIGQTKESDSVV